MMTKICRKLYSQSGSSPSSKDLFSEVIQETYSSGRTRKLSGNFLEAEEGLEKTEKAKREKYASTGDGYKAMKKISVNNVEYNIMSQDISKMPVKATLLTFSGIFPRAPKSTAQKTKKKVRWRNESGMESHMDVKIIDKQQHLII